VEIRGYLKISLYDESYIKPQGLISGMFKALTALGRVYEVILAFFLLKVASDYLPPSEFAKFNLFLALTQGVALFFISPFQNWILVNNKKIYDDGVIRSVIEVEFLYSLFCAVLAYLFFSLFLKDKFSGSVYFFVVFVFSVVTPVIFQTLVPIFNLQQKVKSYFMLSVSGATLGFILPVLFVIGVNESYLNWAFGIYLAQFLISIVSFCLLSKDTNSFRNHRKVVPVKKIVQFSLPLSVAVGFQWFNSQGFRLQIENYIDLSMLGYFLMGFTFGGKFLNAIEKVFSTLLLPMLYNRTENTSPKKAWVSYLTKMTFLYVISSVGVYLFSTILYENFISEDYAQGMQYIVYGIAFDTFRCILNAVYQFNMLTGTNYIQVIMNGVMSLVIFISITLVSKYDLLFFAHTMPIAMFIILLISFFINMAMNDENS
jgi:O-antigen/teichoic acid export membrane protein